MTWGPADAIDRTAKILIDSGKASDPVAARLYLETLILQVAVGPEITGDPAAQAALATVVNVGRRAYRGGVHVQLQADPPLTTGWTAGLAASRVITQYGGTVVTTLREDRPTLVIGAPTSPAGGPMLHLTWADWSAGVVRSAADRLGGRGTPIAGVLAAGLGISETFQQALGAVVPGRRDVGVSLWRPDLPWRDPRATGPRLEYLPAGLWLLGLGHLGQANAWTIGMLPYATPTDCEIGLVDFDTVVAANTATQLLTNDIDVGARKTRVVAAAMEGLGLRTRFVERAFDDHFHVTSHAAPNRDEPLVALAGFDKLEPRRQLGGAGFARIVDAGLGAGPIEYLDIAVHSFPAAVSPADAFVETPPRPTELGAAYEAEVGRQMAAGTDEMSARCGMLDIAGVTVGAAFVGAVASALAVSDLLRVLHDGQNYSVLALDLREPDHIRAARNMSAGNHIPKFTLAFRAP